MLAMRKNEFEETLYWLWFTLALGSNRAIARSIYSKFKSPEKIFRSGRGDYKKHGIPEEIATLLMNKDLSAAERELWFARKFSIDIVPLTSEKYPVLLKNTVSPPLLLYVRGVHFNPNNELYITITGTKNTSQSGLSIAYNIAKDLALAGVTIVAGQSPGIETAAYEGCLSAGGHAVAALVTGVNKVYPRAATSLQNRIMNSGAVISEYPLSRADNDKLFFAERNRIIAGISAGTLIAEATEKSNSLKTANMALDEGRDVFAVPGDIKNSHAVGSNELLKFSGKAITCAKDILEEYEDKYSQFFKISPYTPDTLEFDVPPINTQVTADEIALIDAIRKFPKTAYEISNEIKKPLSYVNGVAASLEMRDKIKLLSDNRYTLK